MVKDYQYGLRKTVLEPMCVALFGQCGTSFCMYVLLLLLGRPKLKTEAIVPAMAYKRWQIFSQVYTWLVCKRSPVLLCCVCINSSCFLSEFYPQKLDDWISFFKLKLLWKYCSFVSCTKEEALRHRFSHKTDEKTKDLWCSIAYKGPYNLQVDNLGRRI